MNPSMSSQPTKTLETFLNPAVDRDFHIHMQIPEFTCLCPKTGQPDFATLILDYVPDHLCVELKSLKLYINGFRDQGIFHEDVTNLIFSDLEKLLAPQEIEVIADFNVRGNIRTVVRAAKPSMPKLLRATPDSTG
jgi:7-cyano-7-deazaguanine reductase